MQMFILNRIQFALSMYREFKLCKMLFWREIMRNEKRVQNLAFESGVKNESL